MKARGVPMPLRTLASWEVGARRPVPMASNLLEEFLAANPTIEATHGETC
jgi:DNA-binding transcriptional regulator YiaG